MGMRRIYVSAQEGKDMMEYELTPEKVMEIGKGFEDAFLACFPSIRSGTICYIGTIRRVFKIRHFK
jgi:hypothetical protein